MVYKVLVVDDSAFFRRYIREVLSTDTRLEVVGEAKDGREALALVQELDPDVVTMDVDMPVMDGISAVQDIMKVHPVPILMLSSLTYKGAAATFNALEAGALDFLPKKFEDIAQDNKEAQRLIVSRILALGRQRGQISKVKRVGESVKSPGTTKATRSFIKAGGFSSTDSVGEAIPARSGKRYRALAIGTSTGGPVALQTILSQLPGDFPYPILLVQHMPGTFTSAFAQRLNSTCSINVKEAESGDILQPGTAYLAPGGRQMLVNGTATHARISIEDITDTDGLIYKPSIDASFTSLSETFGADVLAIILTGMGADGKEGCTKLKARGSKIWSQDEKTSVVYGMPQVVAAANISERSIALPDIATSIQREM